MALLGIAVSASLTWAAMRIAGQRIGIAAAPVSVIRGLAPRPAPKGALEGGPERVTVTRTVTVTAPQGQSAPQTARPVPPAATGAGSAPQQTTVSPGVTLTTSGLTSTGRAHAGDGGEDSARGGSSRVIRGRDD